MSELATINSSGDLTEIKLGGTTDGDKLLTSDEISNTKFGNWTFDGDNLKIDGKTFATYSSVTNRFTINGLAEVDELRISGQAILFNSLTNELIDSGNVKSAVTKEWVESKITGATGSFVSDGGETVTVVDGLITSIV